MTRSLLIRMFYPHLQNGGFSVQTKYLRFSRCGSQSDAVYPALFLIMVRQRNTFAVRLPRETRFKRASPCVRVDTCCGEYRTNTLSWAAKGPASVKLLPRGVFGYEYTFCRGAFFAQIRTRIVRE